jgi:hypothetical protein
MTGGKRKANTSRLRAARPTPGFSFRKNAPRRPGQIPRSRRASLRPNRIRPGWRMTNGSMKDRRQRNCCATTIRRNRHGPRRTKIRAARIQCRLAAATAPPCRRLSVGNFLAASARRRFPRLQACPSAAAPHAASVSPARHARAASPACACQIAWAAGFPSQRITVSRSSRRRSTRRRRAKKVPARSLRQVRPKRSSPTGSAPVS